MAGPDGTEIEIKIAGAARDIAALRKSPLMRALRREAFGFERLVSTYYDTPAHDLEVLGVTLRLRDEGGGRMQTIKRAGAGGSTVQRLEEETPLPRGAAFPAPISEPALVAAIAPLAGRLSPVVRTLTDRWSTELRYKGARIEASFDIGRAEALVDGHLAAAGPLAEAEFELLDGDPPALFALARLVVEEGRGRLRIGAASKAEQARRLARRAGPAPPESALVLRADERAADAFAHALSAAAHRLADCQSSVLDARAPEGVHQLRVALRRLRAIERLFRADIRSRETQRLARRARAFAAALGPARDWDVLCSETLPELRKGVDAPGLDLIAMRAERLRAEAWEKAAAAIGDASFSLFLLDLAEAAHVRRWRESVRKGAERPARAFARRALDRRLQRVRARAAAREEGADARHALRIEIKKLRYAAQLFRPLFKNSGRKTYIAALGRLQDAYGALNDADVAQRLAARAAKGEGADAARAAGLVAGYSARRAEAAVAAVEADLAAFLALRPFWAKNAAPRRASKAAM